MATNLAIDDQLLREAKILTGLKTKKETVNQALREMISRKKQIKVIDLFGQIEFNDDYDYKNFRKR